MPFPDGALVYDYRLDDGLTGQASAAEEEEDDEDRKIQV